MIGKPVLLFMIGFITPLISVVEAAPVTIEWSGTITKINGASTTPVALGEMLSGQIVFDEMTPSLGTNSIGTRYSLISSTITFNSIGMFVSDTDDTIMVNGDLVSTEISLDNDDLQFLPTGPLDEFNFSAAIEGDGFYFFDAEDIDGTVFSSTSISELVAFAVSGDLGVFEFLFAEARFLGDGVWGNCQNGACAFVFELNTFELAPSEVPIPAAFPLFIAGISGMFALGRRRKNSDK